MTYNLIVDGLVEIVSISDLKAPLLKMATHLITTASIPPPATRSTAIVRRLLKSKSTTPPQSSRILDPPISKREQTAPSVFPPSRGVTRTISDIFISDKISDPPRFDNEEWLSDCRSHFLTPDIAKCINSLRAASIAWERALSK